MAIEAFFTMWEWETIIFHEMEVSLKSIKREIIPADTIDENIPEWEWIFIDFELNIDGKKKTTKLSILSEPYESIKQQNWKNYKLLINKVKDYSVKFKLIYDWE